MSNHSWRKTLAVPAVVSLAFGGALLAAGPALATPADTAPTAESTAAATSTETTSSDATAPATTEAATTAPATTEAPDPVSTTTAADPAPDPTTTAPTPTDTPTTTAPTPTDTPTTTAPAPTDTPTSTAPTPTDTSTASAAAKFALVTPVDGVPSTTATPVFSGTGTPGATVEIDYIGADKAIHIAGTATVADDGTWTITTSFADLGPGITKVVLTVGEVDATGTPVTGATPLIRQLSFTKPPVQAQGKTIVLTPDYPTVDGASTAGIGLAVTGFTANEPLSVAVTGPDGKPAVWAGSETTPAADADGAFSELIALPATAPGGNYVVTVTGATSGLLLAKTAYVLGDPTITSPTAGEKIIGTKVTFTGTGTPGSSIGLVIAPTSALKAADAAAASAAAAADASSGAGATDGTSSTAKVPAITTPRAASSAAGDASTDPSSENIAVGASGTWSVTVSLAQPGDYTAFAIAGLLDANGDPISDNTGVPVLAGPSADVEFVLAAAPVVTTSASGPELAFTGSNAAPYAISGGLAVLLGAGLLVATRRRREDTAE